MESLSQDTKEQIKTLSEGSLLSVYAAIFDTAKEISNELRYHERKIFPEMISIIAHLIYNEDGELKLDMGVHADALVYAQLKSASDGMVATAISEERPYPTTLSKDG